MWLCWKDDTRRTICNEILKEEGKQHKRKWKAPTEISSTWCINGRRPKRRLNCSWLIKYFFLKRIIKNKKMVLTSVRIICRPAVRHGRRSVIVWDWCSASGLIYLAIINLCSLLWNCTEKLFQENVKAAVYDLKFVRVSVIQQNNGLKQINNNSKSCPSGQVRVLTTNQQSCSDITGYSKHFRCF